MDCFVNASAAVLTRCFSPGRPASPSHVSERFKQALQSGTASVFSWSRGFFPSDETIMQTETVAGLSQKQQAFIEPSLYPSLHDPSNPRFGKMRSALESSFHPDV